MAFIDSRLPTQVEINAVRHDVEDVEIVVTDGGWEVRNARQSQSLREFDIAFPTSVATATNFAAVIALYKAARGQLHAFRLKDFTDFQLDAQLIGTGDGSTTVFNIIQTWTAGGVTVSRRITRPVAGINVYKAGVLQTLTTHYTLGALGVLTFLSAPANGLAITVTGTFDLPVRFDSALQVTALDRRNIHIDTLNLKEVREA